MPWTRNERSAVAGLKTTSYAENVVAVEYAHQRGASEGLFANTRGELCEGTGSNVFLVVGGRILTPPLASGCLAGVTRALVIEWCGAEEATLSMSDLAAADEVFLTSSTRDVHPVSALDGRALPGTAREDGTLGFPFFTIEDVARVDDTHILVGNDNNLPFSGGREIGRAADNEFMLLSVPELLSAR